MENRSRPLWERLAAGVSGALAVLALGATMRGQGVVLSRPREPEAQRGLEREALVGQGWSPASPQKLIKPTYWPFVFGLGIAFLLGGIPTDFMVSGVGLFIFVFGLVGWVRDLLDEQDNG